jgi:hypothetical protein
MTKPTEKIEPLEFHNYAGPLATFPLEGDAGVRIDVKRGRAYISTLEARTLAHWLLAAAGDAERCAGCGADLRPRRSPHSRTPNRRKSMAGMRGWCDTIRTPCVVPARP